YGITECSPVLTVNPIIGAHRGVGQPLSCVELAIVHPETFEAVPIGDQGLILARGSNVFHGYINPDVASPFIQHEGKEWYVTGDLGFLDKDGYLTISGRLKRFIKIGGEMISLASIEDALSNKALKENSNNHAEGPLLAVSAKESVGDKVKIVLFSTFPANVDEINDFLRKSGFSNLARISSIIQVKEIPLMGSGKTNYRVLEAEYLNRLFA
ncbi:MAG: AMP-binding protein, partial [Parachlamydiaceae bacterium]